MSAVGFLSLSFYPTSEILYFFIAVNVDTTPALTFIFFAVFYRYSWRIFSNDNFLNIFKTTKKLNNDKAKKFRAHGRTGT
jgi:hypothetical protein